MSAAALSMAIHCGAAHATVPMIVDGGFEGIDAKKNAITTITGQSVGGWSGNSLGGVAQYIANGNVQVASGAYEGTPRFGQQYLVLDQIAHRSFRSIESQTISGFMAGQAYQLSVYFAALTNSGGTDFGSLLPPSLSVALTDGSDGSGDTLEYETFSPDFTGPYGRAIPFQQGTVTFTALSDTVTLSLGNQSYHSALGIDNVSLSEVKAPKASMAMSFAQSAPVPEPASWISMLAGLALVGTGLRQRRRALVLVGAVRPTW